jgi:uncharacterized protein (DUF1810 family)
MSDPHHLQRFFDAQAPVFESVRAELRRGRKVSHWMWFIFPQIEGLGHSTMAQRYAITGIEEAAAFLSHSLLGPRLLECCRILHELHGRSAHGIFGSPDDWKLRSSLTLFSAVPDTDPIFDELLQQYFDGQRDPATLARL